MNPDRSIFQGDGRRTISPINAPKRSKPIPVTRAMARVVVNNFVRKGSSVHGPSGATVWIVITYCREQGKKYEVKRSAEGWFVKLIS